MFFKPFCCYLLFYSFDESLLNNIFISNTNKTQKMKIDNNVIFTKIISGTPTNKQVVLIKGKLINQI